MIKKRNLKTLLKECEKTSNKPIFQTGIDIIDDNLGGFETGQLVTITGEQEAGKTALLNHILLGLSKNTKCLYFSLEFSTYHLYKQINKIIDKYNIDENILENIDIVTNDDFDGDIDTLISYITSQEAQEFNFIGIDSTLMLFDKNLTGEQEITSIFRKLHYVSTKFDKTIFVITQSSKEDNKEKRALIFGSQKANHLAHIMIHLLFDKKNKKRTLQFVKNKHNGFIGDIEFELDNLIENRYFCGIDDNIKDDEVYIIIEKEVKTEKEKKEENEILEELKQKGLLFK